VIERLLIAAGILVVNGAVLVGVLRLLTMVVIRRVPRHEEAAGVAATAPAAADVHETPAAEPEPELVAAATPVSEPVLAARPRSRRGSNGHLYRIHHHRMLLGVPVLAAIFASGAWLGDWVGGGSSADAATVTVHLKGKIIRVAGAPVAVRVPATTVHTKGRVVTVPGTTVQLPGRTQTVVTTNTINNTSTETTEIVTTLTVPTTVPTTVTDSTTATETTTVTETTTITETATSSTDTTTT
jgi:hypothetical protein